MIWGSERRGCQFLEKPTANRHDSDRRFSVHGSVVAGQSVDYGGYRPHYQGYGVNTPAGRGGSICRVTSLSDSAWPTQPGTLRHCVETSSGPRFVIFEISGTIKLAQGPLFVKNPFITIAGQTAPSPGILIRGPGLIIDTHDVVVQHVRVRVGSIRSEPTALWVRDDATRVVIDHVSLSWSIWTSLVVGSYTPGHPAGEVTIIDSIIAESLGCSGVNTGAPCNLQASPEPGLEQLARDRDWRRLGTCSANSDAVTNVWPITTIAVPKSAVDPIVPSNNLIYNPSQAPLSAMSTSMTSAIKDLLCRWCREMC